MNRFLVDTNVLSEFGKPNPDGRVMFWFDEADPDTLFVSAISLGELRLGIENLAAGKRRFNLELWLATGLPAWFATNLLPVTGEIAQQWARLTVQAKRRGRVLSVTDGLIAATALEHNLTLVTRNVKDFDGLGVELFNPWAS